MRRVSVALAMILLTAGCAPAPASTHSASSASPKVPVGTIAFSSEGNIYVVNTDGTGLRQLTHVATDGAFDPAWSPDGTKIAYTDYNTSLQTSWHLWVMDADGSNKTRLTQGFRPAWSPDGSEIAYGINSHSSTGVPISRIYVMNADGTGKRPVTSGPVCDAFPTWTPNGMIVFSRYPDCSDFMGDVFAVNPDGSGLVPLTTEHSFGPFSLSPDGTRIAIQDVKRHRIVVLQTYRGSTVTLVPTDFGSSWVLTTWAPDGNTLAFAGSSYYSRGKDLYIVNADGSGLTKVPHGEDAVDPAWRPTVTP